MLIQLLFTAFLEAFLLYGPPYPYPYGDIHPMDLSFGERLDRKASKHGQDDCVLLRCNAMSLLVPLLLMLA